MSSRRLLNTGRSQARATSRILEQAVLAAKIWGNDCLRDRLLDARCTLPGTVTGATRIASTPTG
eukprot:8423638-Lingulodinium_polyedra.AAC.1